MPIDGIFLHNLCSELNSLIGCRAEKIHQPSRDELVFLLRSASFSGKLLISARSGSARLQTTNASFENPADPPTFCKLLRKHLSSAKLIAIEQEGLDRTVFLRFMAYNEMGDPVYPYLAVELITGKANIILCDESGRIFDALHRTDIESSVRMLQPGAKYQPPLKETKLNPYTEDTLELAKAVVASRRPLCEAFSAVFEGVSPLISRELASKFPCDPDKPTSELSENEVSALEGVIDDFKNRLENPVPTILADPDGGAKDFSYMPILQYSGAFVSNSCDSFSGLLEEFFAKRDRDARIKAMSQDLLRLLKNTASRTQRKIAYREADLEKCKNREHFRICGELIKANIFAIEKGANSVRLQNYYDENLEYITIELNPALSAAANAAKYFKDYKKTYSAEQHLSELIKQDEKELVYIDSVLDSLSRAQTVGELAEIREELESVGYIKSRPKGKKASREPKFKEYLSPNGFKIFVGRNNRENDLLTLKTASKEDVWFHVKNIPGSHTVLFTEGKTPPDEDLIFAAEKAALYSKASASSNVPVDFTAVKNVKKPSGTKPGMVIYSSNKTIFVNPR